jgi:hypothetical protein
MNRAEVGGWQPNMTSEMLTTHEQTEQQLNKCAGLVGRTKNDKI